MGRPTQSLTYREWINTVKYGVPRPLTAAEFVAAITGEGGPSRTDPFAPATLGEAGYDPQELRDKWGRWTRDGSRSVPLHTVSYGGPGNSPDENGGKEIDAKDSTKAARDIKDFIGASAILRAKLKEAAKGTDKVERGGVLMQAVDPTTKPPYKFVEEKSKENTESSCRINTGKNGFLPEVPPNGTLDADHLVGKEPDKRYRVIATWHTHPPSPRGDAWPSGKDVDSSHDEGVPGIGIQRWPAGGEKPERYDVWMTDEQRGYFHVGEWQGDK
jgi:proteasome lid subunit RPN8/RPN11